MIFVEILGLIACIGGLGIGATMLDTLRRKSTDKSLKAERIEKQMQNDLRDALRARDRRLDDWLIIYADHISPELQQKVMARRDELYLDKP